MGLKGWTGAASITAGAFALAVGCCWLPVLCLACFADTLLGALACTGVEGPAVWLMDEAAETAAARLGAMIGSQQQSNVQTSTG